MNEASSLKQELTMPATAEKSFAASQNLQTRTSIKDSAAQMTSANKSKFYH
jgi:hypothetical protein